MGQGWSAREWVSAETREWGLETARHTPRKAPTRPARGAPRTWGITLAIGGVFVPFLLPFASIIVCIVEIVKARYGATTCSAKLSWIGLAITVIASTLHTLVLAAFNAAQG